MAISDNKITDGEKNARHVQAAPDVLSDTTAHNKAVFDNLTEYFIGKYNDLIDDIDSDFLSTDEMGAGLTVDTKVSWRYALSKGTTFGFNFSGNITQITTGYRTIVGNVSGLTEYDFMDAYLTINSTDYECGDSWTSGNTIYTTCTINGIDVSVYYDTVGGNITLEHSDNPLSTAYWNVSMYRSVAEKVPAKCLPADLTGAGYAELSVKSKKWNEVALDKVNDLPDENVIETSELQQSVSIPSGSPATWTFDTTPDRAYNITVYIEGSGGSHTTLVIEQDDIAVSGTLGNIMVTVTPYNNDYLRFSTDSASIQSIDFGVTYTYTTPATDMYIPAMREKTSDRAELVLARSEWTNITINSSQTDIKTTSKLAYSKTFDGGVTIIGNLDFSNASHSAGYIELATFPDAIKPLGSTSGLGVQRNFGVYRTNGAILADLYSQSGKLNLRWSSTVSANDYVVFEFTYHPSYARNW